MSSDLDKILMRFVTIPLALSRGPPGLPVLDSTKEGMVSRLYFHNHLFFYSKPL